MTRSRKYQVRWTLGAKRDVASIGEYLAGAPAERLAQLREAIVDAATQLARYPMRGRVVPELRDFGIDFWRELVFGNYRIFYRVEARRVVIGLVLDGRRDVEHVLIDRLMAR